MSTAPAAARSEAAVFDHTGAIGPSTASTWAKDVSEGGALADRDMSICDSPSRQGRSRGAPSDGGDVGQDLLGLELARRTCIEAFVLVVAGLVEQA